MNETCNYDNYDMIENVICTIKFNMNLLPLHICIITIKLDD